MRQLGSPWSETLDEVPGTETDSLMCMAISDKRREKFAVMLCINKLGTETFTKHDHAVFEHDTVLHLTLRVVNPGKLKSLRC